MSDKNAHGLSRSIPSNVAREVRIRSKFGCVACRAGVAQYEHIDPDFKDARSHDPARMCLLCGACHDKVTRGQWSKEKIAAEYERVQRDDNVQPPRDFLDFHTGAAALRIGGLFYNQEVRSIFKVGGQDIIAVVPGEQGAPGRMTALFSDDEGNEVFAIRENVWEGNVNASDIMVQGSRICVKSPVGRLALRLRLEPPGTVVIEHIDMRHGSAWLIASETSYAVGRASTRPGLFVWTSVRGVLSGGGTTESVAVEVKDPWVSPNAVIMGAETGVAQPRLGVAIGRGCNMIIARLATTVETVASVRARILGRGQSFFTQ